MANLFISSILFMFFIAVCTLQGNAEPLEDKQALLDFVSSFQPSTPLNWTNETPMCDQRPRVVCNSNGSRIIAVRFHGLGLHGPVPTNTISRLSELRTLILQSNGLTGNFPSDFANLKKLIYLDLQSNNFSGPLPEDFSIWKNLTVVNLSNNAFNGTIPSSLSKLPYLSLLNLSNNHLDHAAGPAEPSVGPAASPEPSVGPKPSHLKEAVEIYALCGVSIMICLCGRPKRRKNNADMSSDARSVSSRDTNLVFFEGSNYRFDLNALLHSSTEILGSTNLGTSYKVVLDNSVNVVVKRLKDVGLAKEQFKQAMEMVQRIHHENVASLKGYYFSDDIKMVVYEYFRQGSLASILHGTREGIQVKLNWETRVRIALSVAKGLACIHLGEGGILAHDNVKSSNIFLTSDQSAIVSGLGEVSVTDALPPPVSETIGNRAPEGMITWKAGQPADVYGFGVVLLELLTRKAAIFRNGSRRRDSTSLVMWVSKMIAEEWTGDVFDPDLMGTPSVEGELVEMLHIAMMCVEADPDDRPRMPEVVSMIEDIR